MKQIAKWKADDGAEFNDEAACAAYESLCAEVAGVMARLPPRPDDAGCRFSNGHGYLKHDPVVWLGVQRDIARIGRRSFTDECATRHFNFVIDGDKPLGHTMIGRFIDDGCPRPVYRAWSRLMCVDQEYREWGQPYYALHPDQAEHVAL